MLKHVAVATVMLASPAMAQDGAWRVKGDRAALPAAKLALPARAGALALTQMDEASNKGQGLDNFAQFQSADGQVQGTAYVYRAILPDAALAAYATDRAIRARFGPSLTAESPASVPLAGQPGRALRHLYSTDKLATGAAFVSVGPWLLKVRVSGPVARRAEVAGALDALLAGVRLDRDAFAMPVQPLSFDTPCPAPAAEAKPLESDGMDAEALLGMLMGGKSMKKAVKSRPITNPNQLPFPSSGYKRACVRGTIRVAGGGDALEFIQPAGVAEPDAMLAALNDAGGVLAIQRSQLEPGFTVRRYGIGQVDQLGKLDRLPGVAQLGGWLGQKDAPALVLRSRTVYKADGTSSLQLPGGLQVQATKR